MDQKHSENTKRIAKNTLFLYGRMIVSMVISLFTARVILNALGVEDFGVQNVVGGFIGMVSFLNASMSGATSRFITYELGTGNKEKLKETLTSAFIIHIGIALAIVILAETVGLWFLEYKLVIPEIRMTAARILYQMSVFGTALGIMQTPFGATMVAHENLSIYAYLDILGLSLKLLVVYLITIVPFDKLIFFGTFNFIVGIIMAAIYLTYCWKKYEETHIKWCWNKPILRSMMSFSGWDLFGNMSVMARTQGVAVLLNLFFGPVVNAAVGIAGQVQNAVMAFGSNIITAFRPQIVKQYAAGDYEYSLTLMRQGMKITTLLLALITVPLMSQLNYVIGLWLGQVPEYVVPICSLTLIFNFFAGISILLAAVIHATGRMKRISLINGSLYILVVPISYIMLKMGIMIAWMPFLINVVAIFIGILSNAYTIKLYIPQFKLREYVFKDYFAAVAMFLGAYLLTVQINHFMEEGFARLVVACLFSTALLTTYGLTFILRGELRKKVFSMVRQKLSFAR